ncbi:unnamed protein product [Thelazia callipaeda]|uniref:Galectin n=1 Tax=Thelazia callipaeda TaxID=103827 RepID=A0A0N5D8H4_THECL|nr:unnamed protein product [Thelazia callipaeda]
MASVSPLKSSVIIADPTMPYIEMLPEGLYCGLSIVIKGIVLNDSNQKRFVVELCCGMLINGDHRDNKALHFNPRFDSCSLWFIGRADRQIVLNSLIGNKWGMEERVANTFKEGCPFSLRISVLNNYFHISLDGQHLCNYLHRIPITEIKTIHIAGNVRISTIEYEGPNIFEVREQGNSDGANKFSINDIIRKPKVPFELLFTDSLLNVQLLITATPLMNAECFAIDLLTSVEHFFHLRVDFSVGNKKEAVVRNSTKGKQWQKEEREMYYFPFMRGITFDMKFNFSEKYLAVVINSSHFTNFNYREFSKLVEVERIAVRGDLSLQKIELR